MNISGESLLVILAVGIAAGWLAGQIVEGTGLGLVGDLVVGIAGPSLRAGYFRNLASISVRASSRRSLKLRSARYCCSSSSGSSADGADGEEAGAERGANAGRRRWNPWGAT